MVSIFGTILILFIQALDKVSEDIFGKIPRYRKITKEIVFNLARIMTILFRSLKMSSYVNSCYTKLIQKTRLRSETL